jgi:hypothetical protein
MHLVYLRLARRYTGEMDRLPELCPLALLFSAMHISSCQRVI